MTKKNGMGKLLSLPLIAVAGVVAYLVTRKPAQAQPTYKASISSWTYNVTEGQ